jgi:hypothetical protein
LTTFPSTDSDSVSTPGRRVYAHIVDQITCHFCISPLFLGALDLVQFTYAGSSKGLAGAVVAS